jgi:transposase
MNKREQAKELRAQGLLYREIAEKLEVSKTTARCYVIDHPMAEGGECKRARSGYAEKCERLPGHSGIHLANDENAKLIWWE